MLFDPATYPVDDVLLHWGATLAEIEALLHGRMWWKPYGGWPNLRGPCQSVFGLAASECQLSARVRHKPVLQVSYELTPPTGQDPKRASPSAYWVLPLTDLLGLPTEASRTPFSGSGSDGVVYSARWERWPVRLSLSVYGGVRLNELGRQAAAGLYLDLQDLIGMAGPWSGEAQGAADALAAVATRVSRQDRFETQPAQEPFYVPDFDLAEPNSAREDAPLRKAQRALYCNGLCDTPTYLADELSERQVLLWAVPYRDAWAVSNKWDTVLVSTADPPKVELTILSPAKGNGSVSLSVGDLNLKDDFGSPALSRLAQSLEEATGIIVERAEYPDC